LTTDPFSSLFFPSLTLEHESVLFPLLISCGYLLQEFPCGRRTCRTKRERVSVHHHPLVLTKMDPGSLTVPSLPTITFPLSPLSLPPSSAPTPVPSPLNLTSQNAIMSGIVRNKAGAGAAQPPRPPNAWILYRSDKLQQLPPPLPGHPKPTQAEVSKIISAQWRNEREDVRALYEQRAEMAKAEHARLYPNYRFAPMKRADKDRIREERRQAKEQERAGRRGRVRVAPYPPPSTAPAFKASVPLSIKRAFPNTPSASPPSSSASSPSSTTPPSQPCVSVVPYHGSARVTPDASIDPQRPLVDSQILSSRETSHLKVTLPVVTSLPVVPPNLTLDSPRPSPPKGWQPSSLDSPTTFPSPPEEISLPDWPQTLAQPTQVQLQACLSTHLIPPVFLTLFIDRQPSLHNTWLRSFVAAGHQE
jgi:hypothetical protein